MNRKDTIIIAVLINAGLLALLFMLAVNTDQEKISDQLEVSKVIVENQIPAPSQKSASVPTVLADVSAADEVDNFLKDLVSTDTSQSGFVDDEGLADNYSELTLSPKSDTQEEIKPLTDTRFVEVTVKRGDALEKIARNNGTTVDVIKKINNLSSSKLVIGQVLRVPISEKTITQSGATPSKSPARPIAAPKPSEQKTIASAEPQYYTIKSGDNPWKIAKQYQVKFDDLLKMNDLDEEKARNLKVGDKVRVR